MKKIIKEFLLNQEKSNKKRFHLNLLEDYIIDSFGGYNQYDFNGGYPRFYEELILLKQKSLIREINSSDYNGYNPPLKTRWEILSKNIVQRWDSSKMLQFSDFLDFSYYVNNPAYQSDLEWEYIENIYSFLKSRELREYASIEERSLELFYDEKFLKNRKQVAKGKYGILKRLKLSHEDLKMKRYGEMFIYWNPGVEEIKNIIILENHSTFFTYKKIAEVRGHIFGFFPDIIIYGEGKKIEKSFSFLEEIANVSEVKVLYFGDIDSEGFAIFERLKARYPHIDINIQQEAYKKLISICNRNYPLGKQEKNNNYLDSFLQHMEGYLNGEEIKKLKSLWERDFRIPQELVNYEYLLKVKK